MVKELDALFAFVKVSLQDFCTDLKHERGSYSRNIWMSKSLPCSPSARKTSCKREVLKSKWGGRIVSSSLKRKHKTLLGAFNNGLLKPK